MIMKSPRNHWQAESYTSSNEKALQGFNHGEDLSSLLQGSVWWYWEEQGKKTGDKYARKEAISRTEVRGKRLAELD